MINSSCNDLQETSRLQSITGLEMMEEWKGVLEVTAVYVC